MTAKVLYRQGRYLEGYTATSTRLRFSWTTEAANAMTFEPGCPRMKSLGYMAHAYVRDAETEKGQEPARTTALK